MRHTGCGPANTERGCDPCECQGPHGSLMGFALIALLLVIELCPEGVPDRCSGPLHERWSEELWTLEAPVDPGLLPAAFGDRYHTRLLLQCGGRGIACALVAKGDEGGGRRKQAPYTSS